MEDVLDLYEQPYDPKRPVVCYDEWRRALIGEPRPALPAQPGQPKRYDYEYERNGAGYLHMFFEPLLGQRQVQVTEQHTMKEFAQQMQWLTQELYPEAEVIRLVMDNLATHKPAALYVAFPPAEARQIIKRLEFHYTPKHGSWLNMAEIELSTYHRSLKRHLPDLDTFSTEALALTTERNQTQLKVNWQFRSDDARIKLKRLYPSLSV
jgi:transposase